MSIDVPNDGGDFIPYDQTALEAELTEQRLARQVYEAQLFEERYRERLREYRRLNAELLRAKIAFIGTMGKILEVTSIILLPFLFFRLPLTQHLFIVALALSFLLFALSHNRFRRPYQIWWRDIHRVHPWTMW